MNIQDVLFISFSLTLCPELIDIHELFMTIRIFGSSRETLGESEFTILVEHLQEKLCDRERFDS